MDKQFQYTKNDLSLKPVFYKENDIENIDNIKYVHKLSSIYGEIKFGHSSLYIVSTDDLTESIGYIIVNSANKYGIGSGIDQAIYNKISNPYTHRKNVLPDDATNSELFHEKKEPDFQSILTIDPKGAKYTPNEESISVIVKLTSKSQLKFNFICHAFPPNFGDTTDLTESLTKLDGTYRSIFYTIEAILKPTDNKTIFIPLLSCGAYNGSIDKRLIMYYGIFSIYYELLRLTIQGKPLAVTVFLCAWTTEEFKQLKEVFDEFVQYPGCIDNRNEYFNKKYLKT